MFSEWLRNETGSIAEHLLGETCLHESATGGYALKTRVERLIHLLQSAMYPNIYYEKKMTGAFQATLVTQLLQETSVLLLEICEDVITGPVSASEKLTQDFMESLPDIARMLDKDITAAYDGDPAARSREEVMLSYPAFETITIYRLAHRLFELNLPIVPRMMTEYAHSRTGIDIHPGAIIGEYFFIDHGTGVVIGETCVIGRHVKLYQGVTLGAKSFDMDENGHPVKGGKRHPDVEDRVVIYAGATILGGDVVIGKGSVIGGSVWLTKSVPPYSIIYNTARTISVSQTMENDWII
ncbi:MAG: serine acetyltransferase [Firmicutes bacterium]|nr:serine acetyltransferase [Bacillota bacterium]